ncbi:MAG: phosphate/phosphite/phosphonate ABC transporter substrate-binding protein [Candidatus Eisenbacteria bacterium]|nr:phosphate/phosphite/phosphonate ABC transporter substrate-binding protein [Candidatus Eisenbacteria bacterium]
MGKAALPSPAEQPGSRAPCGISRGDPHALDPAPSHSLRRLRYLTLVAILCAGFSPGCNHEAEDKGPRFGTRAPTAELPVYRLAIHPLHNPARLLQAYQPLVDYLNTRVPHARLVLEASRDYGTFEEKYRDRRPDFLLPNPWQTLQAMKAGYHVIAMAGQPRDFKGLIVVRVDSPIRRPADLKGKAVSYPSPTALAACVMPQYFLHRHGVDVTRDIENRYVGSQESSIMNVYLGQTAAGATWPPPWRAFQRDHPKEAAMLKCIWETESLLNNSVMARDDIRADVREQVRALLLGLEGAPGGREILDGMETGGFLPATDRDYDAVRRYVARFEREVRPVETR